MSFQNGGPPDRVNAFGYQHWLARSVFIFRASDVHRQTNTQTTFQNGGTPERMNALGFQHCLEFSVCVAVSHQTVFVCSGLANVFSNKWISIASDRIIYIIAFVRNRLDLQVKMQT